MIKRMINKFDNANGNTLNDTQAANNSVKSKRLVLLHLFTLFKYMTRFTLFLLILILLQIPFVNAAPPTGGEVERRIIIIE